MATIILSITPMQIAHVKHCVTSKDTWNIVQEIQRAKGPVRKVTLFIQILNMLMVLKSWQRRTSLYKSSYL